MKTVYDRHFYDLQKDTSYNSAKHVIPVLMEIIAPRSVLDIGCGLGTWLKAFDEYGIDDYVGADGEYINEADLLIPKDKFLVQDITQSFNLNRQFDLVVSLEVGEHIRKELDDVYFQNLIRHSELVFFSAAIPYQGGTNHVNEQWQNYWGEKFIQQGYIAIDYVRRRVWDNKNVEIHYIQNSVLYVRKEKLERTDSLKKQFDERCFSNLSVVHPKMWLGKVDSKNQTVRNQFDFFKDVLLHRIKRRIDNAK